jgi:hypothetical protein
MTQLNPETPSHRQVTVGAVNWRSVLDFTQLFRGFRLAINPAKIALALFAILLIYSAGRLFDFAWGPQVYTGEIESYQREKPEVYKRLRIERNRAIEPALREKLMFAHEKDDGYTDDQIKELPKNPRAAFRALRTMYQREFHTKLISLRNDRTEQEKLRKENKSPDEGKSPAEIEQEERAKAARRLYTNVRDAKAAVGTGIFESFLDYELSQFDALVETTLTFVRVVPMRTIDGEGQALSGGLVSTSPERMWRSYTIVGCVANMAITGPVWLFTASAPMQWRPENADTWGGWMKMLGYRALYLGSLLVFALFTLIVLALTGATLSRMSALELAGIERAPVKDAFLFSLRRLWVFIKAPMTPFLILLVVGLFLAAVGLIGAIPYIGEIILGIFFILFLVVGFILMLLLLGVLGGFNLLYPTIAVEGSDAFDAMSRSFAYVYARPWRLIFYSVVSLIYGVITYLFVSFAVYLVLLLTHTFVGWGTNLMGYVYGAHSGVPKMETLCPTPRFTQLSLPTNWYAMSWSEYIGSLFLHFWVYMLISAIGAYVISYYFSTHTIIYLLLRRSVDGQATTEVFTEDTSAPPEIAEPSLTAAPSEPTTTSTPTIIVTPPASESGGPTPSSA